MLVLPSKSKSIHGDDGRDVGEKRVGGNLESRRVLSKIAGIGVFLLSSTLHSLFGA